MAVRLTILLTVLAGFAGCSSSSNPETASIKPDAASLNPQPAEVKPPKPAEEPAQPKPAEVWSSLIKEGEALLAAGKLDELDRHLAKFDSAYAAPDQPAEQELAAREALKDQLAAQREEQQDAVREAALEKARGLLSQGKYEEATQAANAVQTLAPTTEQREEVTRITTEIENRRTARRRLATWMQLLASDKKTEIRSAQTQLQKEADTALPLLFEAVQNAENPVLVANTLELLRRIQRPQVTLPQMLGVLQRESQEKNWPDAVREIGRTNVAGIGPKLLELTLNSQNARQRAFALTALSQVPDPPAETFLALLPRLFDDGPDLPAALQASAQAVRLHRQGDLAARRGFTKELTAEQEQKIAQLSKRLEAVIAAGEKATPPNEAAEAARLLSAAIGQRPPQVFESVKVLSFGAQMEDGKAAAVVDGVWNKVDYPTMWRHPVDRLGTIVLDLGEEKVVEAVRIWNFNEPGGMHRGWKEVEVFVTSTPTALNKTASGIVLPAPGAADTPDYSTTIPVPSVRGRYVTLQARSVWRPDTYTGLSEVQVLGY